MRGRIGALAAMDEAEMRALQQAKKVFRSPDEIRELCPLPVAATTAWMQEVERSRMPEPKALPQAQEHPPHRGRRFSGEAFDSQ